MNPPRSALVLASVCCLPVCATAGLSSISIVNPGFQADNYTAAPGYNGSAGNPSNPTGWTQSGGGGVNGTDIGAGAPFSDGAQLDGTRAGFIQGSGTISQGLSGFTPGAQYYFQGYFRGRNCCGDVPVFNVNIGATSVVTNANVGAGTWQAISVPFTAGSASQLLSISSAASAGGDASLAYDGFTIFQLDSNYVPLLNPSFEAGGTSLPFPGYTSTGATPSSLAGWTKSGDGNVGYNYAGNAPFADNGAIPEGQAAGFIQNGAALSQIVSGLAPGQVYNLELDYNTRNDGNSGHIQVNLGGTTLLDAFLTPVGGSNPWYHLSVPWTAGASIATLEIKGIANGPDATVVFDNVNLRIVPEPSMSAVALLGLAATGLRRRK